MTVATELVRLGDCIFKGRDGVLELPEYVMPDELNTSIPNDSTLLDESLLPLYPIGSKLRKRDGIWRYCKAGAAMSAVGFLKGNYVQCPGKAGNSVGSGFEGALYAPVSAGDTSFTIADTAATKNLYAGAYFVVYNDTDSIYEAHEVIGNDVSTGVYTTCYIADPGFKVDLTTAMGVTIYLNEYRGIRTMTGGYMSALGYAKMGITSAYHFWMQTAGRISGITGASTWPGQTQYYRDVYCNTDGSLIGYTAGYQRVGYLLARTASDYGDNFIMLQLDQ
uniref:Uncharacterized protein n=1 Tax=viral metagenome TaxID=1070528 RepID=A0A6H1Z815_9ZZZZ